MIDSVKVVGVTTPTIPELTSPSNMVAYIARVSNPANQFNTLTASKLLRYLVKHKHWSPFEMVNIVMEINTTRDIGRQILRHRSFTFQEFSQRYANPTTLGFETREARLQDEKNRQNSIEIDTNNEQQRLLAIEWERAQKRVLFAVQKEYDWAIANGIAKEQARAVLPEGLTASRMYMNGTLRSWIHFIQVRSGNGTQKEHMLIAREVAKIIAEIFPLAEQFVTE